MGIAPSRTILGISVFKETIVDSVLCLAFSLTLISSLSIASILQLKSLKTSSKQLGFGLPDILADGATIGTQRLSIICFIVLLFGNLIPTKFLYELYFFVMYPNNF